MASPVPMTIPGVNAGISEPWGQGTREPAVQAALAELQRILAGRGRTDPARYAALERDIDRGAGTANQELAGILQGLGGSGGLRTSLQRAHEASYRGRKATSRAEEATLADERKRKDLDLIVKQIYRPYLEYRAISKEKMLADAQRKQQKKAAEAGFWSSLIGAFF